MKERSTTMGYRLVITEPSHPAMPSQRALPKLMEQLNAHYPTIDAEHSVWTEPPTLTGGTLQLNIRFSHAAQVLEELQQTIALTGLIVHDPQID
ncbi:MAG: hypothetical protein ACRCSF_11105 [Mycobacteriaceae bacterium]